MIGDSRVIDLRAGARHMTGNTIVALGFLSSNRQGQAAASFLMAMQTPSAEVSHLFFLSRTRVGIMTGNAAQLVRLATFVETAARVHLLDGTDKLVVCLLLPRLDEVGEKELQRQSWSIVKVGTVSAKDSL